MNLVTLPVREFVAAVASVEPGETVPAGGSVVALTGASSAALLALVCGVLQRRHVVGVAGALEQAQALQERLLALVDEDAEAFRAFLKEKHSQAAVDNVSRQPLNIARACAQVVDLSRQVEDHTQGAMLGDVKAARHLAAASVAAALDIADQDVPLHADAVSRTRLADEIAELRRSR